MYAVVGAWLRASPESQAASCTLMYNFTTYMNWDYGVISTGGISTNVTLNQVSIADSKFAGALILVSGAMTTKGTVTYQDCNFVGVSSPDVCGLCTARSGDGGKPDAGCHSKVARTSYNQVFQPKDVIVSRGLVASVFALSFSPGPETYAWDGVDGYALIHGITYVNRTTFANFWGNVCPGEQCVCVCAALLCWLPGTHAADDVSPCRMCMTVGNENVAHGLSCCRAGTCNVM